MSGSPGPVSNGACGGGPQEVPLWWRSATELRTAFLRGETSPVAVVDALAARIAALNPDLNALVALCLDRAVAEARRAARVYELGAPRPLEGIPFAAKDLFDSAGVVTAYGSALFEGRVPARDANAIAALRAQGAILVGKAATHELAWGMTTVNPHFGTTRNPWDRERIAGGSSGGSAAAVAAGLVPLALGTDTAGSIRVPAAFCGVVGLKPTLGAVSLDGVMPLAPTLDHGGVLARTPEDAALALSALTGRHRPPTAGAALRGLRVGFVDPYDPDVATIVAALGAIDAVPVRVMLPAPPDVLPAFATLQRAEAADVHREQRLFPDRRAGYGADVRERLERAQLVTLPECLAATTLRERLRGELHRVFAAIDVLVLPLAPMTPPTIASILDDEGDDALRERVLPTTILANLLGLPACAVRTRFDDAGMPRAGQVVGAPRSEELLLGVARAVGTQLSAVWARRPRTFDEGRA